MARNATHFYSASETALPKFHVVHTLNDTTVPSSESHQFLCALHSANLPATESVILLEGDHFSILKELMGSKPTPTTACAPSAAGVESP
eukprot:NODE_7118_length_472_cov_51.810875_g6301_i0.p1 GENE.NODE_7118_length_472_cov_51.810875_g6301_i0~~NODE_7118_length_472_cov_51.810875_g6301_i0.p1  ORF type:complete len:89 (-),score=14.84 NODE_7118_length_472_cov_51.810875_g6301_i0:15-281(-)